MIKTSENIIELIKYNNYVNKLIKKPDKNKNRKDAEIVLFKNFVNNNSNVTIDYSIVTPIYNQECIICTNLKSVLVNTLGNYEIILIIDGCTDNSEDKVVKLFEKLITDNKVPLGLKKLTILRQPTGVYETSCDNLGFIVSEGTYIVEIQADMKMITLGYNILLSRPVRAGLCDNKVFMVSGRASHNITTKMKGLIGKGKMSKLVDKPLHIEYNEMNKFYVNATICRGPLLIVNDKLMEMGYLDEHNFVQGNDDIDLSLRAYFEKGWVVGYYPIEFYAPLANSSMQKNKKIKTAYKDDYFEMRKNRGNGGFFLEVCSNLGDKYKCVQPMELNISYNNIL